MKPKDQTVFIVCLYGLFDDNQRTAIEMEGYRSYLRACTKMIIGWPGDLHVIFTGGLTSDPSLSEAASVQPFVTKLFRDVKHPIDQIYLEESGINHPQNIARSMELVERLGLRPVNIIICCDSYRTTKVRVLARCLVPKRFRYEICGFFREDIHPNSCYWRQWLAAAKYFFFPSTIQADLEARHR